MKNIFFLLTILAWGCSKSAAPPDNTGGSTNTNTSTNKIDSSTFASVSLLAARWSIVSDTVANVNNFSIDFYQPPSRNYIGGPNDYITFTTGGVVSGSEDSVAITGAYTLSANNGITLSMSPSLGHATVTTLTANACTITGTTTNGNSSLTETIYLKR